MKPKIWHVLSDRNVGAVTACTQSMMRSPLGETYDFQLLTPSEALSQIGTGKPDLVVFHDPCSWVGLLTLVRFRLHAKVLIHDHHYSGCFEAKMVPVKWRFRLLLKFAHAIAHRVVAVSFAQGKWMVQAQLVPRRKLTVIQQCRTLDNFLTLPLKPLAERLVLGCYGRFSLQKGIDQLLQAMRELPGLSVELRLGGYGEQEAMLHQLSAGDRRIHFAGKLSDIPAFLAACDVVVIPSRWEPWGNVCLEAKAAAKPVIVTNVDGLPEQVEDCGIVVEPTVGALQQAIADVVQVHAASPQTIVNWGLKGREVVLDAWERYLNSWAEVFSQLIS